MQQMRLVQAYRFSITALPDMLPVLVQRYEGPDGKDIPRFVREWSVEGPTRRFAVDVSSTRPGQERHLRTRFQIYTRTKSDGDICSNPGLQHLATRGAPDVSTELIVFRRDDDGSRLLNMRQVDVYTAEAAAIGYMQF